MRIITKIHLRLAIACLLSLGFTHSCLAEAREDSAAKSWLLPPREVPIPDASGEVLRKWIIERGQPNISDRLNRKRANTEQLMAALSAGTQQRATTAERLIRELPIKVEQEMLAGVPVYWTKPQKAAKDLADKIYINIHGGAHVQNWGIASTVEGNLMAARINIPVVSIDYRMPPKHQYPAGLNDILAVYQALLKRYPSEKIALGGTSSGANLVIATIQKLKELKIDMPASLYLATPWSDLSKTGDTLYTLEGLDLTLISYEGGLGRAARLYAGDRDLKDPLMSPLYGDFSGFPPTLLISGTRDLFLSDTARTHRKLRAAGVEADLHIFEGLSHGEHQRVEKSAESLEVYREWGDFMRGHF